MSCHIFLFIFFSNEPKHIVLVLEHDCLFFDIEIRVSALKQIQKLIKRMQVLILQDGLIHSNSLADFIRCGTFCLRKQTQLKLA